MSQPSEAGPANDMREDGRLSRRPFLFNAFASVATIAMGTAAVTAASPRRAEAQHCVGDVVRAGQRCTTRRVRCPTCPSGSMLIRLNPQPDRPRPGRRLLPGNRRRPRNEG